MSDLSVDMNRALTNEAYAASCIRRGCDANTRCQITAQWGADKVKAWESVDSTQYEIDDVSYSNAYNTSKQNVKDSVGYSGGKDLGAIGDAALSVAGTGALIYNVANVGLKTTVNASTKAAQAAKDAAKAAKTAADTAKDAAQKAANKAAQTAADETATETAKQSAQEAAETAQKAADKAQEASKEAADKASQETTSKNKGNTSAYIAAGIAIATAAKYTLEKPNKEQVRAANELLQNQLPESQGDLQNAQSDMLAASEEVTALTEEANEANEDANDKIEDDKTQLDFYRAQYDALKVKAEAAKNGGTPLTADEKTLMQKLAPLMEDMAEDINTTNEETSDAVNELYDEIEGYQSSYDAGAETIASVEAVTDYAESFDSTTRTMCYVEAGAQGLNAITGFGAAAKLMAGGFWNWALGIAAGVAGGISAAGVFEQTSMASQVSAEIDAREQTQDLGAATNEVYETELDNFAGSMEFIDDLEIEIPEDLDVPDTSNLASLTTDDSDGTGNLDPLAAAAAGVKNDDQNNSSSNTTRSESNTGNQPSPLGLPNEKDPNYINKMGNGSDWHEVANGNIKRDSDDDIVKDSSGKVVLISDYANAIKSVTGSEEGEYFSKDDIPKIMETLLGSPFDAKMIKKVRNGHKLSSEYATAILGTKDQDYRGQGSVDNTEKATAMAKKVIDFYYQIFAQASTKGWVKG